MQCISHDDPEIECAGEVHEHRSRSGCTVAERCERHQALHDQHMNAVEAGLNERYPGWNTLFLYALLPIVRNVHAGLIMAPGFDPTYAGERWDEDN